MKRFALILAAVLLCSGVAAAADEDDIDELLYSDLGRQRNTQEGLSALMRQVAADLDAKRGNYRLLWIYAALNYFQGDFYSVNPDDKKKYYTLCREYADQAVKANPKGIAGHYWLGIGLAKWAEANGVLFSLFSADDIMMEMTTVIDLNPSYLKGIPFAVRASVYAYAPGVISVGDWDKARADIASAFVYGKDNRSNYLLAADIYIYWGEWENAKKMVDEGLALPYDSRMPLEENDCITKLHLRKTKVEAELVKRQKK